MPQAFPFYFGPKHRALFGWLHLPDAGLSNGLGLLICGPLGYESISAHRTLRHLAEAAASAGYPALRFDYDGTGDSAGSDLDPDRVETWLQDIRAAAGALREMSGANRACLFGMRLGASLGLLATQDMPEIVGAALLNPVIEGRRYLRELRALAATSALPVDPIPGEFDGVQQSAGFLTTAATRESLGKLQLTGPSLRSPPRRILLLDRTDLPTDETLALRLVELGSRIARVRFPGYADMMRDPHESTVPEEMTSQVLDWMSDSGFPLASAHRPPERMDCVLEWSDEDRSGTLREHILRFGSAGSTFGILSEAVAPADTPAPSTVVLLANSGSVHHIGPNRLYVSIARRLALEGVRVLRFDIPGIGDSTVEPGKAENHPYPDWALESLAEAASFARQSLGASRVCCAGICSGAYHSFKAASSGVGLHSVLVINPLTFFWRAGMSLAQPDYRDTAEIIRYRRTGFSASSLRKLLTGRVNMVSLSGVLARSLRQRMLASIRNFGRSVGIRLRDDLAAELRNAVGQGTRLHFLFSSTDPGYLLLLQQAGGEVGRLRRGGGLTIDLIDHADHTFTPWHAQRMLINRVSGLLAEPQPRSP